jgi:thiol-disulfide isomerase/thioredoxin
MKSLFTSIFVFAVLCCFAQTGYKINFKIKGLRDTTIYLGYYIGETTYVKDTAKVDSKGQFAFESQKPLAEGIFFLGFIKGKSISKLFEIVIDHDQQFSMTSDTSDYVKHMSITGDVDNTLFFKNMIFNWERHNEAAPFTKLLQDTLSTETQKKEARDALLKINKKVQAYQDEIINKNPTTLTARVVKMNRAIEIPDPPKRPDGSIDSTFQLTWYRQHFFDNFDLADEAFIHMPVPIYQQKINEYLDKLFIPTPDSVERAIDFIVSKAKKNQETYKYAVWMCMIKYQRPEIMGLDEVYVRLYDKYFATGEMDFWANAKLKKNIKDEADRFRKSLIGQIGANLIMLDNDLKPRSMYDLKNKYTVLFIFAPDCGHCKEETPHLVDFYNKNKKKFDLEVFAVSADTSMAKMRNFIKDMKTEWITVNGPRTSVGSYHDLYDAVMTPSLYVLDSHKKIIGKKIPAEKLEDFLTHYEMAEKRQAEKNR